MTKNLHSHFTTIAGTWFIYFTIIWKVYPCFGNYGNWSFYILVSYLSPTSSDDFVFVLYWQHAWIFCGIKVFLKDFWIYLAVFLWWHFCRRDDGHFDLTADMGIVLHNHLTKFIPFVGNDNTCLWIIHGALDYLFFGCCGKLIPDSAHFWLMLYVEIKIVEDLCPLVIRRSLLGSLCLYTLVELMTTVSCYGVIAAECRPVSNGTAFLQALSESCNRWIPDYFFAIVKKTSRHRVSWLRFLLLIDVYHIVHPTVKRNHLYTTNTSMMMLNIKIISNPYLYGSI